MTPEEESAIKTLHRPDKCDCDAHPILLKLLVESIGRAELAALDVETYRRRLDQAEADLRKVLERRAE